MAILAGIDEAGFGPILGPLVTTAVAFRVPDDCLDACLWRLLRDACARKPGKTSCPIVVCDSKQLYRSRTGLAGLERSALVMLAAAGTAPSTSKSLFQSICPKALQAALEYPWYVDDFTLPVDQGVGDLITRANAVRRSLTRSNVAFLMPQSELLFEGHYNRLVDKTRNKSSVLIGLVLRLVEQILAKANGEPVRLIIDRLGGRLHYREHLMTALPEYELTILEESAPRSAYLLTAPGRRVAIEFVIDGDQKHFPVAMASIYSKYLRELAMQAFNLYWSRQLQDLQRTAGYYNDAERWLRDADPAIRRLAVDRNMLVRMR